MNFYYLGAALVVLAVVGLYVSEHYAAKKDRTDAIADARRRRENFRAPIVSAQASAEQQKLIDAMKRSEFSLPSRRVRGLDRPDAMSGLNYQGTKNTNEAA